MTSRFALVAAAATLFGAYSANAADLGGGCCADLEERVAELEATTARKGNRVVSLQVYGLVSRGILAWEATNGDDGGGELDDGESADDVSLIDEDGSIFGFRGSATIKPGWTAGYRMEFEVAGEQASSPELKQNNLWIESEQLGRVTIGQASVATDGIAHIVLANTWSNSAAFQNDIYTEFTAGSYGNFDGGRGDLIRYDSPSIAGFILSASWSDDLNVETNDFQVADSDDDEVWDVTLRYSGEFNAFRLAAGIGYTDEGNGDDIIQGSASIMHVPTGLFASFSAGEKEFDGGDSDDYWYINGGVEKTWLSYGATTVYAEYGEYADGDDDTMWGAGLTQRFDAAALDIYLQYRHVEEDDGDDEFETFLLGTSIAF
ncbi:MAG: porin [Hyphomicrobiales bacterium]|nr:porin [Hyphomicrobiales bacterium]